MRQSQALLEEIVAILIKKKKSPSLLKMMLLLRYKLSKEKSYFLNLSSLIAKQEFVKIIYNFCFLRSR